MAELSNTLLNGWQPDADIDKWATKHSFGPPMPMSDSELRAFARNWRGKPKGLYLWESADHEVYVGISNASVTTRLRQHVKDYDAANIQVFRYRANAGDRAKLRDLERELIHDAIGQRFRVFNREHSAIIYGSSVFDEVIPVERQEEWFADPVGSNASAPKTRRVIPPVATTNSARSFDRFKRLPEAQEITKALGLYLGACTPFPFETEAQFWSLTCLPGYAKQRIATLNMAYLEMLFLWRNERNGRIEVHLGVDSQYLPPRRHWLRLRRQGVRRTGQVHGSGGPNEAGLVFKSLDSFTEVMTTSDEIRLGAARFALDRMRKGRVSGRYSSAHNVLLAEEALARS